MSRLYLIGKSHLVKLAIGPFFRTRVLVICTVLFFSCYLATETTTRINLLILGLILGIGAVYVFLRWPPLGLTALILASLTVPFSIGTGTQTRLNITVLFLPVLIALWLVDMVVLKRDIRLAPSRVIIPLITFLIVALLSFFFGQLPWFAAVSGAPLHAQLGGLAVFLLSAGAFLLMAHQVTNVRWLQLLTWLYLLLGGLYIFGRLVPGMGSFTTQIIQSRATGSLLWIWLVALACGQAVFNRRLHPGWRLTMGVLVLATLYLSLGRNPSWTSGWLPALVGLIAIFLVGFPRLAPVAILLGGFFIVLNFREIYDLLMIGGNEYSLITRLEAWSILAKIIKVNPVLGLGPANYYWYTPLFPILGWSVSFNSHNQYVDIVAQTGILGLLCFLWFVFELGRLALRLKKEVAGGFAKAYVYGALGGLVGTLAAGMLGDWLLPFVYNLTLTMLRTSVMGWLFLGGLVALEQIIDRSSDVNSTLRL